MFVRYKNSVNIIMKVFADITIGTLCFYLIGFGLMYGDDLGGVVGKSGFALSGNLSHLDIPIGLETFWLFQCAFVIAGHFYRFWERWQNELISAHIFLYAILMTTFIYPIAGHWIWGGGWISKLGMLDFAGSAVIHALGGFSALAAAIMIGPRKGKFTKKWN